MSALSMIHAYNNHSPAVQMFAKTARDWARSALAARISAGDQATSS
jgi:hypothetical protein